MHGLSCFDNAFACAALNPTITRMHAAVVAVGTFYHDLFPTPDLASHCTRHCTKLEGERARARSARRRPVLPYLGSSAGAQPLFVVAVGTFYHNLFPTPDLASHVGIYMCR